MKKMITYEHPKSIWTLTEIMNATGLHRELMRQEIMKGRLQAFHVGSNIWLVNNEVLDAYLEHRKRFPPKKGWPKGKKRK